MTKTLSSRDKLLSYINKDDLIAAPMAGISTPPFRLILRKFFDGIVYSEMVSVEGIIRKVKNTICYLQKTEKDAPLGVQLFGSKPESFIDAVKITEEVTEPEIIDVNMGCPVKKVLKSGSGAALLKDLRLIEQIVKNVRKSTDLPFTIKIRPGFTADSLVYKDILNIADAEGVDAVAIHGRVKTQMFSGTADYGIIRDACEYSKVPVIGNGDVIDRKSYLAMKDTGCTGVMIGRAMMKQPWVFKAIREDVPPHKFMNTGELYELLKDIIDAEKHFRGTLYYLDVAKRYAVWFSKGYLGASDFRQKVYSSLSEKEFLNLVDDFFTAAEHSPQMSHFE